MSYFNNYLVFISFVVFYCLSFLFVYLFVFLFVLTFLFYYCHILFLQAYDSPKLPRPNNKKAKQTQFRPPASPSARPRVWPKRPNGQQQVRHLAWQTASCAQSLLHAHKQLGAFSLARQRFSKQSSPHTFASLVLDLQASPFFRIKFLHHHLTRAPYKLPSLLALFLELRHRQLPGPSSSKNLSPHAILADFIPMHDVFQQTRGLIPSHHVVYACGHEPTKPTAVASIAPIRPRHAAARLLPPAHQELFLSPAHEELFFHLKSVSLMHEEWFLPPSFSFGHVVSPHASSQASGCHSTSNFSSRFSADLFCSRKSGGMRLKRKEKCSK